MRTPKTPEAVTQREVAPSVLEGKFDTQVPGGNLAFGGVTNELQRSEEKFAETGQKIQDEADAFAIKEAKNYVMGQGAAFMPNVLNSQGKNSIAYSPTLQDSEFGKFANDVQKNGMALAKNPRQAAAIKPFIDSMINGWSKQAQNHVLKQLAGVQAADFTTNRKLLLDNAGVAYDDPDTLKYIHDQGERNIEQNFQFFGKPEQVAAQKEMWNDQLYGRVLQSYRNNGQIRAGKKVLDDLKAKGVITGREVARQEAFFDKTSDQLNAQDFYRSRALIYRDANGYPDISKIHQQIMDNPNLTDEQKKIYDQQAQIMYGQQRRRIIAKQSDYKARAIDIIKPKDGSESEIHKVNQVIQNAPTASMRLALAKLAAPDHPGLTLNFGGGPYAKNFAQIHHSVYEAIETGQMDQATLDKVFTDPNSTFSKKDYMTAQKLLDEVNHNGVNAAKNQFYRSIYQQAMDVYSDDPDPANKAASFMNELRTHFAGSTDTDMSSVRKWVSENLDPSAKNPSSFWDKIQKQSQSPLRSEKQVLSALNFELGAGPTNAILGSLKNETGSEPSTSDLARFLHELGDVPLTSIGRGTPINNTMRSILDWNHLHSDRQIPFTPQAIKALLERHPNGFF